jgi:hypothetical protein
MNDLCFVKFVIAFAVTPILSRHLPIEQKTSPPLDPIHPFVIPSAAEASAPE